MNGDEAASWQAWSGVIQAGGAILALIASVAAPIIQRRVEMKTRLEIKPCIAWVALGSSINEATFLTSYTRENFGVLERERGRPCAALRVINHSSFPVVVSEAGVAEGKKSDDRAVFNTAILDTHSPCIPHTIPPMSSQTFVFYGVLSYNFTRKTVVYARTANNASFVKRANLWKFLADKEKKKAENL